eukprot:1808013-Rhodomonas_salina.3
MRGRVLRARHGCVSSFRSMFWTCVAVLCAVFCLVFWHCGCVLRANVAMDSCILHTSVSYVSSGQRVAAA